jgi:PAS domain S-box-containing protein
MNDYVVARGVIIGMLIVPSFLAISLIALRSREPDNRALRFSFAAAFMVTALLWAAIIVIGIATPGDHSLSGPDPANPIFFIVTILMDIVATGSFLMLNMARTKSELRESELLYRNLADNLPDYVLVYAGESILYSNPAATRLMDPSGSTLAGRSIYSFLTPERAETQRVAPAACNTGESPVLPGGKVSEADIRLPDGTIRHCLVKTVGIEYKGIPSCLAVITDITERKDAENALSRANKKLTILSSITRHDLKNQLTALSAYLDLSADSIGNVSSARDYISNAIKITRTMEEQIDFTKIYEDMGTTAPVWQNVSASIRRASATLPLRDVTVTIDRSDIEIRADPLFEKVFYNLIENALHYGGDGMTSIQITSKETAAGLVIACEDNGVGIPDNDKSHLFTQGFGKHTGLGLFLSREILLITGISITETGTAGKGARFEITVPGGEYRFTGRTGVPDATGSSG